VQALPDDHPTGGRHSDVLAKAPAVLSESGLLRAEFDVGSVAPSTPPGE
jgi:hypothetical protein